MATPALLGASVGLIVTVENVQGRNGFDKGLIILSILTIRLGRNGFDKGLIIYNLVLTIFQGTNRLYITAILTIFRDRLYIIRNYI